MLYSQREDVSQKQGEENNYKCWVTSPAKAMEP